jgi:translation elongation factor EF-Tu-like GTPase
MEALMERGTDVENWNDDRLDELSRRMDAGFNKVDRDMKDGFARVDDSFKGISEAFVRVEGKIEEGFVQIAERIDQTNQRIDRLMQALLVGALGALVTLGATLLGAAVL